MLVLVRYFFWQGEVTVYKVNDSLNHGQIFYPEKTGQDPIFVSEIGFAAQPAGFDSGDIGGKDTTLCFVTSGKGVFKGTSFTAPTLLFISPKTTARYVVDTDCNDFVTYWIKCNGESLDRLLLRIGFSLNSEVIPLNNADTILPVLQKLTDERSYIDINDSIYMIGGLYRLLACHSDYQSKKVEKQVSGYTQTILDHIHANYSSIITEKDLANTVNLSTNYMHKVFLCDMQTTPINYLNSYRIKCAKVLLRETDYSIARVAESVGISGGDYFCRVFRKYTGGLSPTEYRKQLRNGKSHSRHNRSK